MDEMIIFGSLSAHVECNSIWRQEALHTYPGASPTADNTVVPDDNWSI